MLKQLSEFNNRPALEYIIEHYKDDQYQKKIDVILDVWKQRFFPESCEINVDCEDELWIDINRMAHNKDVTLNQIVTLILEEQIKRQEENQKDTVTCCRCDVILEDKDWRYTDPEGNKHCSKCDTGSIK